MNHQQKTTFAMLGCVYTGAASAIWVESPAGDAALIAVAFAFLICLIRLYIKGDPAAEAARQAELRRTRIEELEKDLDLKPLNLHELHEIIDETQKEDRP